jgi:hypothetical protein
MRQTDFLYLHEKRLQHCFDVRPRLRRTWSDDVYEATVDTTYGNDYAERTLAAYVDTLSKLVVAVVSKSLCII